MNRRGFLGAIVGIAASPIANVLPFPEILPEISGISISNWLFSGELGQWDGVTFCGDEWTEEELVELRAQRMSPLVINLIRS
jgi:hypothetical protein